MFALVVFRQLPEVGKRHIRAQVADDGDDSVAQASEEVGRHRRVVDLRNVGADLS